MRYIKFFEEMNISGVEFPRNGLNLFTREKQILLGLVSEYFLSKFNIRREDFYYYTYVAVLGGYIYNKFDGFNELKSYILFDYYIEKRKPNKIVELLKEDNLDPSFDHNYLLNIASERGYSEVVKLLLQDPRVDPSTESNTAIIMASVKGYVEIVNLLLNHPKVREKLTQNEIDGFSKGQPWSPEWRSD